MTEARMSREITRELRVLTDDDVAPPMIRAMRIERRGHPSLVLPLYPDVEYVFGRSGDSSVVFTDDAVSRQHGRLWCDAQLRWVYRDLSSSNGEPSSSVIARISAWPLPGEKQDEAPANKTVVSAFKSALTAKSISWILLRSLRSRCCAKSE